MANPRRFFYFVPARLDVGGRALAFGLSVLVLATPLVTFLLLPATRVDVPRDQQHRKKQYCPRTMRRIFTWIGHVQHHYSEYFFQTGHSPRWLVIRAWPQTTTFGRPLLFAPVTLSSYSSCEYKPRGNRWTLMRPPLRMRPAM
jgi:hypothetical protein